MATVSMSMFASVTDYWKYRAETAERNVEELAAELGCPADNEVMLATVRALKAFGDIRGPHVDDPRSDKDRLLLCSECLVIPPPPSQRSKDRP